MEILPCNATEPVSQRAMARKRLIYVSQEEAYPLEEPTAQRLSITLFLIPCTP